MEHVIGVKTNGYGGLTSPSTLQSPVASTPTYDAMDSRRTTAPSQEGRQFPVAYLYQSPFNGRQISPIAMSLLQGHAMQVPAVGPAPSQAATPSDTATSATTSDMPADTPVEDMSDYAIAFTERVKDIPDGTIITVPPYTRVSQDKISIKIHHAGMGKKSSRPPMFQECGYHDGVYGYREDTVMVGSTFAGIFDGHGAESVRDIYGNIEVMQDGSMPSRSSATIAKNMFETSHNVVVEALMRNDFETVQKEEKKIYTAMEDEARHKKFEHVGNTATTMRLVQLPDDRIFLVASGVGDSPMSMGSSRTEEVMFLIGRHGWDEEEEYGKYIIRCREIGQIPRPAIYGRINTVNGVKRRDHHGSYFPMRIYEPGTNKIDEVVCAHICSTLTPIGGAQAPSGRLLNKDGTKVINGYGHKNSGATVLLPGGHGGMQFARTVGDLNQKRQTGGITHIPDTLIIEINPRKDHLVCIVAMSDGVGDILGQHEAVDIALSAVMKGENPAQEILREAFERLEKLEGFKKDTSSGRPTHDDTSVVCMVLNFDLTDDEDHGAVDDSDDACDDSDSDDEIVLHKNIQKH